MEAYDPDTLSFIQRNSHIPDEVILQDIKDTEDEVRQAEAEISHYENTPREMYAYKYNQLKASAHRLGIIERKAFISKLQQLLDYKKARV